MILSMIRCVSVSGFQSPTFRGWSVLLGALAVAGPASAAVPTTAYDADSNVFPNAPGQVFAGGYVANAQHMSLVDLGSGDRVFQIDTQSANTDQAAYLGKIATQSPSTWNVSRATGYSVEVNARMDPVLATEGGSFDIIFGNPDRGSSLRLVRAANGGAATASFKSAFNNTIFGTTAIPNPEEFHTYRIDVLNDNIDLYIDGVLMIDDAQDATATGHHELFLGDATGAGDGKYQIQFFNTYQNGVVPEPASLAGLALGAAAMLSRRKR